MPALPSVGIQSHPPAFAAFPLSDASILTFFSCHGGSPFVSLLCDVLAICVSRLASDNEGHSRFDRHEWRGKSVGTLGNGGCARNSRPINERTDIQIPSLSALSPQTHCLCVRPRLAA